MSVVSSSIVVGVDGSEADGLAVEWAVGEASSRQLPLHIVCAHHSSNSPGPNPSDPAADSGVAGRVVDAAVAHAREVDNAVAVEGEVVEGSAVDVLNEQGAHGALIVLGSRRLGPIGSFLLGSVSATVAARAAGPVVVVRGPSGLPEEQPGVIVGVDGTESSETLLGFGFEFASRRGTPLRAVLCTHPDLLASMEWRMAPPVPAQTEAWLSEALAGWREKYPDVEVHSAVIQQHPTAGLVAESLNQNLLVVGRHTRHAAVGSLLGSVSQGVLHHAYCPVAVIPTQG